MRSPGEAAPLPEGPVWTGLRDRKGQGGRFHTTRECWALIASLNSRSTQRVALWENAREAAAAEWYPCPYCCASPPCCAGDTHNVLALPRLAAAEMPDWEREMLEEQGADVRNDD